MMRPDLVWLEIAARYERQADIYGAVAARERATAAAYRDLARRWAEDHDVAPPTDQLDAQEVPEC